jgi:hypothetical protein
MEVERVSMNARQLAGRLIFAFIVAEAVVGE